MKTLSNFLAPYKNRIGYATILEGIDPKVATYNFKATYPLNLSTAPFETDELFDKNLYEDAKIEDSNIWLSPFSYRTNSRKKIDFKEMSFLALDYDDGVTIHAIRKQFDNLELSYAIYTTKSHQQKKITKSGEVHLPCDRFRVFVPISRNIKSGKKAFSFSQACKIIFPDSDTSCFETARMFHLNSDAKIYISKNKNCIEVDELIKLGQGTIKRITAGNGGDWEKIQTKQLEFTDDKKKADKYLRNAMEDYFNEAEWSTPNTYQKIFGCICHAFNKKSDWDIIYNTLKIWGTYNEWTARHSDQQKLTKEVIGKCFNIVYGGDIKPKNEVKCYSEKDLSISLNYATNCLKLRESRNMDREVSTTDMLLEKAMDDNHKRIIIQSPCGGGKSTAAIAYMATYSSKDNPIWYVAETRKLCEKTKSELEKVYKSDVGYLQGFDPKQCPKAGYIELPNNEGFHLEGIDTVREAYHSNYCNGCYDKSTCNFFTSRRRPQEIISKPTVIMTHKKLINLLQKSDVPPNVKLIIDEELKRWENYSFTINDFRTFKRKMGDYNNWDDVKLSDEYERFINSFEKLMELCLNNAGVELDYFRISNELKKHLLKIFTAKEREELANTQNTYNVTGKYDMLNGFISFFSNNSMKYMKHNIQHIDSSEIETYDCSTDAIQFNIPNKTIILNASAQFSHVCWEDFIIYKLDEILDFSNTTFYCILANATKRRIMEGGKHQKPLIDTILKQADNVIKKKNIKDIFLATDKKCINDKLDKFRKRHEKQKHNIINIARGNIQSNNSARGCEIAIVTMANFTTVSDYLLKAAMANEERIDSERFLNAKGYLKMHKGFDDEQIDEEATRQMIDEIYQTVMRGNIRSSSQNKYEVIMVLTPKLMVEMMKLFPNAKFESIDKELKALIELNDMTEDKLNDLSETGKDKVFYKTRNQSKMKKRDKLIKLIRKLKNN